MNRRALLAAIAIGAAGLGGCVEATPGSRDSTTERTTDETSDGRNDGTSITDGTARPTGAIGGERIELANDAGAVVSFALRMRDGETDRLLYEDTHTFDPGEELELGENYTGRTLLFRAARPGGTVTDEDVVFERTVGPSERFRLAIESATEITVESHSVK